MKRVYLGIGSNVGDRQAKLEFTRQSLQTLANSKLAAFSDAYETKPVGPIPQGEFLNAAAAIDTTLTPTELLAELQRIEQDAGRADTSQRIKWGPRELDLDILFFDDQVIATDTLSVPHPMLHDRWFVLKPLADIAPNLVHPLLQMTVAELLRYVEDAPPTEEFNEEDDD